MIRLDQIKLLESKVNKAVEQIRLLREESKTLRRTVEKSQARMQELEGLVAQFKSDQDEIEQGILRALKNLDKLEDEVGSRSSKKDATPSPAAHAAPSAPPAPAAPAKVTPAPAGPVDAAEEPVVDKPDDGADDGADEGVEDDEPADPAEEQLDIF
jgi:peptidoglycan hydrolase CwlO-like protein